MELTATIDKRQIRRFKRSTSAVSETVQHLGRSMSFVGRRPKTSIDRRGVHSVVIMRTEEKRRGFNPVSPSLREMSECAGILSDRIYRAMEIADRTGRSQRSRIIKIMGRSGGGLAAKMTAFAFRRITQGRTGVQLSARRQRLKERLANRRRGEDKFSLMTLKYGSPPPYLVDTGRFVHSMRGCWNLGYSLGRRV